MSAKPPPEQKDKIVTGSPLPFSVFGAEGQLLLAEGSVVESDHTRRMLLLKGVYRDSGEQEPQPGESGSAAAGVQQTPLAALSADYGATSIGRRFALSIASDDTDGAYRAWVIGIHERNIILTAPRRPNGALVSVKVGNAWMCRAFQMTSAFRFRTTVLKVLFEPFPHVHVEAPQHVERRTVRSRPRAAVFVDTVLESRLATPAVMVDLSVSGGRLAVEEGTPLSRGDSVRVRFALALIDTRFELSLRASVIALFGASDGRHPRVHFYGLKFDSTTEQERLVLHGYVSGQLAGELNSLWQLLSAAATVNSEATASKP
jgi:flagellar protein YcgR/PilZ domain-containing protein